MEENIAEEIFCDEDSWLQMMERVIKGRMLPLVILFTCCLLPQFLMNIFSLHNYLLAAFLGGIIGVYVAVFVMCAVKYVQFKNNTKK